MKRYSVSGILMDALQRFGTATLVIILFSSLLTAALVSVEALENLHKIKIAVTQPVIGKIVVEAFGDYVDVTTLIPPGADPHHYEPSLNEILEVIRDCEAIFTSGPHHLAIEDKILDLVSEGYIDIPVYTLDDYASRGLRILKINDKENYHGTLLSYSGAKALIETFLDFVSSTHPELYPEMKTLASNYLNALRLVSEKASERFAGVRVALYSPVLQYVLYDLNASIRFILTEDPETPSTINDLQTILESWETKKFDLVVITDIDTRVDNKIEEYIKQNHIEYLKINVLGRSPLDIYGQLAYTEHFKSN
ncbi:MAG TPA: hypothetical protein ENL09_00650, partial [Bacteroidetes bacterium]|nr:hypothetical protein [Bacteroidota bacterium]